MQQFVPAANIGSGQNQVVPVALTRRIRSLCASITGSMTHQGFTAYYYYNDARVLAPYNTFEAAGANVPGLGNHNDLRNQQWNLTHTWTINNSLVNEAHFTYMREGQHGFLKNQTTNAVINSCTGSVAPQYCSPANPTPCLGPIPFRPVRNQPIVGHHPRFARESYRSALRQHLGRRVFWQQFRRFPAAGGE